MRRLGAGQGVCCENVAQPAPIAWNERQDYSGAHANDLGVASQLKQCEERGLGPRVHCRVQGSVERMPLKPGDKKGEKNET